MRSLLAVPAALLCCPAVAGAAPFAEPPFTPLARDRTATCLHAAGAGRVAVLGTAHGGASAVELLRVAADGAAVREGSVPFEGYDCPSAAVAPSGAAVVAAASNEPENGMDVILAIRDPGGVLGAPVRVPRTERIWVRHIAAAIASSGAAVVSWVETPTDGVDSIGDDRLMVVRRPAGAAFGAPERLPGAVDGYSVEPVVGIDDVGRATIAWHGDGEPDYVVRVATAKPGTGFGVPQRLTPIADGRLSLSVAADGGALLAYEEETEEASRIRVFERAPGAGRMTSVPSVVDDESAEREHPQVALAPKGGALVAWQRERDDDRGPVVEVALREPGSAFQPSEALDGALRETVGWRSSAPLPAFEMDEDENAAPTAAVGADGSVVVAWTELPVIAGGDAPIRVAVAAGTLSDGWEGATVLGGPGRSADGLAVLAGPPAVLWTDNRLGEFDELQPLDGGRLHRALPGVPQHDPAPPAVTLRAARQRVRHDEPVFVTARCSAACDLRAVAGLDHEFGRPAGQGYAQLDAPGSVRIKLEPSADEGIAPRRGGPLRVTVHATAPGGYRATVARRDARVGHAFVPRPRKPRKVRVKRRGDRLVVTWRTAGPARSEEFLVSGRPDRRFGYLDTTSLSGRGRTRFRAELDDEERAARWVEIEWSSTEPRLPGGRTLVRVRSGA